MLRLFMLVGKLLMMVHLSCRKLPPVCIISRYFPSNFFMNSSSLKSWLQRPTNLTCLERIEIAICPDLILPATMNMLTSLCQVRIYDEDKNGTLPNFLEGIPSLQNLYLSSFPSLVTLPGWLETMTSLQTLEINWRPKLTALPASFKELITLHQLRIYDCPMLVNQCKKETGQKWHKIDHVPKFKLELVELEPSFYEKTMSLWKKSKQFLRRHQDYYHSEDESDNIIDDDLDLN
ncbi:disease resistance protein RGA2-like isoform X2 [Trifolium pratense]|uniref:disease resistance protein RGA2-like isoform X2 n=1 Tax=Trifolium pratense TaxID=57577 RepID=UPI001E69016D|nr:disease resistance protein RGA2-like isoform X2 [Trifolium pratense]